MRNSKALHKRPGAHCQNERDEQSDFVAREFHRESAPWRGHARRFLRRFAVCAGQSCGGVDVPSRSDLREIVR